MVFFFDVLQLLLIVQPPEHVALFSHCHASQCVFVNTHTHTYPPTHKHTITDEAAGHIPTDAHNSDKHRDETFINLTWLWTENAGQWESDTRSFVWSCFCKTLKKICFKCWEQNLFGSNETYGSIARASKVRICIVGSLTGIPIRKASLIFFKSKEVLFLWLNKTA